MSPDDVRKIEAYGRRIATCVLKTGNLVSAFAEALAPHNPTECGRFLLKVMEINAEMTAATDCFVAEAYPTEDLDA